jgi:RND family efflux transporter MFP subunit
MRLAIKIIVPLLVLALAFGIFKMQMASRPQPKKAQKKKIIPIVQVIPAKNALFSKMASGYGTVQAAGSVSIVSQVGGKVVWVNPKLRSGANFKKDEILYKVGVTDYLANIASAEASLKSAEYELQKVKEEADISMKEWEIWNKNSDNDAKPSPLISYKPQMESAEAKVYSAKRTLIKAQTDLERTVYKAPFDCIVTSESIEIGKIIRAGESAGELIRDKEYEVSFAIPAKDAVKINFSNEPENASKALVTLNEGNVSWEWKGYASRIMPDSDSKTGMLKAIVTVNNPNETFEGERPILPIGATVNVKAFSGKTENRIKLPLKSLRADGVVWVVNEGRVEIRRVSIADIRDDVAFLASGVSEGEKIIVSNLKGVVDGMEVMVAGSKKGGGKK